MRFKGLVNRWGLVHSSGNRFKVVNGESVREIISVPSHHIERMRGVHHIVHHSLFFYFHQETSFTVVRLQVLRQFVITLAERRMLEQLPEVIAVPPAGVYR